MDNNSSSEEQEEEEDSNSVQQNNSSSSDSVEETKREEEENSSSDSSNGEDEEDSSQIETISPSVPIDDDDPPSVDLSKPPQTTLKSRLRNHQRIGGEDESAVSIKKSTPTPTRRVPAKKKNFYKCVRWDGQKQTYRAQFTNRGKKYYLGMFKDATEGARIVNKKCQELGIKLKNPIEEIEKKESEEEQEKFEKEKEESEDDEEDKSEEEEKQQEEEEEYEIKFLSPSPTKITAENKTPKPKSPDSPELMSSIFSRKKQEFESNQPDKAETDEQNEEPPNSTQFGNFSLNSNEDLLGSHFSYRTNICDRNVVNISPVKKLFQSPFDTPAESSDSSSDDEDSSSSENSEQEDSDTITTIRQASNFSMNTSDRNVKEEPGRVYWFIYTKFRASMPEQSVYLHAAKILQSKQTSWGSLILMFDDEIFHADSLGIDANILRIIIRRAKVSENEKERRRKRNAKENMIYYISDSE